MVPQRAAAKVAAEGFKTLAAPAEVLRLVGADALTDEATRMDAPPHWDCLRMCPVAVSMHMHEDNGQCCPA